MATYLITDIHGCIRTFRELLYEQVKLRKSDRLYLLGDYTDKGPDSKGVLDEILKLQEAGYQLTVLRGNHDQMLLDAQCGHGLESWKKDLEKQLTLQSFGIASPEKVPRKYLDLILGMPYFCELPEHYLVHAGFNFNSRDLYGGDRTFDDSYAMMNIKEYHMHPSMLGGRTIIHGHKPVTLAHIKDRLRKPRTRLDLDNGCVFIKNRSDGLANLVALHLEENFLFVQPNIEEPYEIDKKLVKK